ncbi:LEAF RUST 10 DISEASE-RESISTANCEUS RECEPTOR-LIKE PROTEIN KINASE-like 2.5 [Typha angustifolia]|uniref:LEAF RUST 10 DISEASE-RESISTANCEUS RECEPTOR-LIKE PROTEIN KINASE-like 2.5 n=1 Tax=Typha angustifolia TaxID=59011 RepID=UPI003C2C0D58
MVPPSRPRNQGSDMAQMLLALHSNHCTIQLLVFPIGLLLLCILLPCNAGCSSSCGHLHDIRYPFRLETDPPECGSPEYQLLCEGNKPIIELGSGRFFVTGISYVDQTVNAVDPAFMNRSNRSCRLPVEYLLPETNYGYSLDPNRWACFVNCPRPVQHQLYRHLPCLSRNETFVYAIVTDLCLVQDLEPSCKFLVMAPTASTDEMGSTMDVFELLQNGFRLTWVTYQRSFSEKINYCIQEASSKFSDLTQGRGILFRVSALLKSEQHFVICTDDYFNGNSYYIHSLAFVVLLVDILLVVLALAILGRFVFAPLSIYIFLAHKFWRTHVSVDNVERFLRNQQALTPMRYSYTDLIAITGHFREKLGQGGFGSVFKATLLSSHHVAVKMLGNSKLNGEEFINEVSTVGRIHHINVVQLLGFCSEGSKRALVYEYMPNGSLDKYIFSAKGTSHRPFTWEKLNDIALGVARGIDYLHRGCDMQILHFDIKPHNVLLDHNFNPKVSDFGLAKLYPKDYSLVSLSAARGTIGYIAPELVSRSFGVVSYKSDVYSFGMLLLEMAGGRRNVDPKMENSSQVYYPSWIYDRLKQDEELMIDNSTEIHEVERKLCLIGLWCIQMKSANRPSMSKVVEMLEGDTDSLEMPSRPFFSSSQPNSMMLSSMKSISEQLSIISEQEDLSNIEG